MDLPMYKTVIGLRHKRLFAFAGNSGNLVDHLVAEFTKEKNEKLYFSKIAWKPDHLGARLTNDQGNFTIEVDIDGLILTYNYIISDDISSEKLVKTFDDMLPECLKILGASQYVNRLGIMNYFAFDERKNAASELSNKLLTIKLSGIADSFTLRFALKNPTPDTLVRTDTLDYTNVIFFFNSERVEEDNKIARLIDINIDYQIYLNPEKPYKKGMLIEHNEMFNRYVVNNKIDELISFNKTEE
jgi:hypothetical protein